MLRAKRGACGVRQTREGVERSEEGESVALPLVFASQSEGNFAGELRSNYTAKCIELHFDCNYTKTVLKYRKERGGFI